MTTTPETLAPIAGRPLTFSKEERERYRRLHAPAHTEDELDAFFDQCDRTQLDPWSRQIYSVRRKQYINGSNVEKAQTQVSIDGLRLQAERSGKYRGQVGPFWCGSDGVWVDVWVKPVAELVAAKVGILRSDFGEPVWGVARFAAYAVTSNVYVNNQKTDKVKLNPMWEKMGDTMIAKCAEALGIRKATPAETSGLYITEEMMQADPAPKEEPARPAEEAKPAPKAAPQVAVPGQPAAPAPAKAAKPAAAPKVAPVPAQEAPKPDPKKVESFAQLKAEIEQWKTVEKANAGIPVLLAMNEPERSAGQAFFKAHRIAMRWETGVFRKDGPLECVPLDIANWNHIKRAQNGLCVIEDMQSDEREGAIAALEVKCHENGWTLTKAPRLAVSEAKK